MDYEESDFEEQSVALTGVDEDRDTLRRSKQAIGLTRSYVPSWTARDAFREFFQNWMDGIMEAQKISRDSISIVVKDSEAEWLATAFRPQQTEMIGFIKFSKSKGTLEIANFKAKLNRKALDLGVSSKRTQTNLAGTHGEGFKVASLVMARKGYQVRYESAEFYWSFSFGGRDKRHLYCQMTPMKDTELDKKKRMDSNRIMSGLPRQAIANIWEDVTVKIGKVYGRNGTFIDFSTFQSWLKVSLALERPVKVFKTSYGDLIMDKEFSGRLYLKGLFLGGSSHSKALKFAYNLNQGEVNRDRARLSNAAEEAALLAKIWAEAIASGDSSVIKEYTQMLREDDDKQWADTNLAKDGISQCTAIAIWAHLTQLDADCERFYHHEKTADLDTEAIKNYLKKKPVPLPTCMWAPLTKFKLVRTPEQQRHHLLANALDSQLTETPYSNSMKRALETALSLQEKTKVLKVVFKNRAQADLDLLVDGTNLIINDKWLDFASIHRNHPCWLSEAGIKLEDFPCDHLITSLYDMVLHSTRRGSNAAGEKSLRRKVAEGLRQMPRMIKINKGAHAGQLTVEWTLMERDLMSKLRGLELVFKVALHRESTCSDRKNDLLLFLDDSPQALLNGSREATQETANCGCPYQLVPHLEDKVTFHKLLEEEEYFTVISRMCHQAFVNFSVGKETSTGPLQSQKASPNSTRSLHGSSSVSYQSPSDGNSESTQGSSSMSSRVSTVLSAGISQCHEVPGSAKSMKQEGQIKVESKIKEKTHSTETANTTAIKENKINTTVLNAGLEQLKSTRERLCAKEQELSSTSETLSVKELELSTIKEALENRELELRQVQWEKDAEKQQLESQIEDLSGENQQLREFQSSVEAQCAELSNKVETLQQEIIQLQLSVTETEKLASQSTAKKRATVQEMAADVLALKELNASLQDQIAKLESQISEREVNESGSRLRSEIRTLKEAISKLKTEISQAQMNHKSMISTLQDVSTSIQGVLGLNSKDLVAATLQGVLGIIRGVLAVQSAAASKKPASIKRERIKDEEAEDGACAQTSKRARKGEHRAVILLD